MSKTKKKLSKDQVGIASKVLAEIFRERVGSEPAKQLKASTAEIAKALVAGLRVISASASRSKR